MFCSQCGEEINERQEFSEDGQLDYPWCERCVDFVDGLGEKLSIGECEA